MTQIRRYGWITAALLIAPGAAGLWTVAVTHEVSLGARDVQSRIDDRLPKEIAFKGPAQALIQSASVKSATVSLHDGKAALAFAIEGRLRTGKSFEIEATAQGVPTYAEGALYFQPEMLDVRRLAYDGESVADFAAGVARSRVANEKFRALIEEKVRKADHWAAKAADAVLRRYLEERPVYRLKDDATGAVMKAALEKIAIEDDRLNVTFSLWRVTAAAISGFFSLLLGLILAVLVIRMILVGEEVKISSS